MHVRMQNETTGEMKEVRVGFSWSLLLFSGFFGVPLFLRGLRSHAIPFLLPSIMLLITILAPQSTKADDLSDVSALLIVGFSILAGFKGNEFTAKSLLEKGWGFADPDDRVTTFAKMKWSLA